MESKLQCKIVVLTLSRFLATTSADHTAKVWKTEDFGLHTALEGISRKRPL
jgi:hypothetical protein